MTEFIDFVNVLLIIFFLKVVIGKTFFNKYHCRLKKDPYLCVRIKEINKKIIKNID